MSRYIDADLLLAKCRRNRMFEKTLEDTRMVYVERSVIDSIPTADVVEVRHGTWYHGTENGAVYAKCSACGMKMNYSCYGYAYCALCGARMDGERSEKNER